MTVVAGEADLATREEIVDAARVRLVSKAEQDAGGDVLSSESAAQQRQGRNPDPSTDQNRPRRPSCIKFPACWGGNSMQLAGDGEGVAERAVEPGVFAGLELAEAVGARTDALDQEVEADAIRGGSRLRHGKGAGKEGALVVLL